MNFTEENLKSWLEDPNLMKYIFSSPKSKQNEIHSIKVFKNSKGLTTEIKYQKHNNIINLKDNNELIKFTSKHFQEFKQLLFQFQDQQVQVLSNKKGKYKVMTKKLALTNLENTNKQKKYLIPDGSPCDFFIEVGIMTPQGKVKSNQYKKFRQINRFLEFVNDSFKNWEKDQIRVVDFGCGKSYLTFALYYYFTSIKNIKAEIIGLDLKADVIKNCNDIATKLNYEGLKFQTGFVKDYQGHSDIDFVVTLHACDTATDDAILFSIKNNAEHMFFVPCCQHELNKQIQNKNQDPLLKYGIFKDRLTAIITDSMRSQLLEINGYKVQCLEFIESEHTAKNILLRCQKVNRSNSQNEILKEKYHNFKKDWNIQPYLENELTKISN